mgnify:FL=1
MKKIAGILLISIVIISTAGCGNDERMTAEELNSQEYTAAVSLLPTGEDFRADVEAGILWVDEDGNVVDGSGNLVEEYSYIKEIEGMGALTDGEDVIEGYEVKNGKIVISSSHR